MGDFRAAFVIMIVANIFDFIDGKVAGETGMTSQFGGFWDSVIDRFSDLALSVGLICLYSSLGRTDYVLITSIAMVFATMTSYTRARAESLIPKCKVGFMERPERIVLFMIGAFTNRMAAVMWVIGVLSIVTVINRIYYTYLELNGRPQPKTTRRRRPLRACLLLDRRARDPGLRPLGHRDPGVRLAHPARLARRPDGGRRTGIHSVAAWLTLEALGAGHRHWIHVPPIGSTMVPRAQCRMRLTILFLPERRIEAMPAAGLVGA